MGGNARGGQRTLNSLLQMWSVSRREHPGSGAKEQVRVLLTTVTIGTMQRDLHLFILDLSDPPRPNCGETVRFGECQHQVSPSPGISAGESSIEDPRRKGRCRIERDGWGAADHQREDGPDQPALNYTSPPHVTGRLN
jgi:hypothetical protein